MSDDRRERLLARTQEILALVGGDGVHIYRDRAGFEDKDLPAWALLDGDEEDSGIGSAGTGYRGTQQNMILRMQIFWIPLPPENRLNVGLGPDVSARRSALIRRIKLDDKLLMLAGSNGYVRYRGMETDLKTGAEIEGQFRIDFEIAYTLDFNKL